MNRLTAQGDLLTGARQTMLSWVKVIEAFDDLPDDYKATVQDLLADEQKFPYTILAPPINGSRFPLAEKLVFWISETLYILERNGKQIKTVRHPKPLIGYLEMGGILLYSWFTVSGVTTEGGIAASTVVYNTATHRHIQPFINEIRSLPAEDVGAQDAPPEFQYLEPLSYKFFNFACNSLRGDEKIIHSVWQPEISRNIFPVFRRTFKRLIAPAHLAILTDKEIIFIEDDLRSVDTRGKRYGGIWRYICLDSILAVTFIDCSNGDLKLSFHIRPDTTFERILGGAARPQAMKLKSELEVILNEHGV